MALSPALRKRRLGLAGSEYPLFEELKDQETTSGGEPNTSYFIAGLTLSKERLEMPETWVDPIPKFPALSDPLIDH